MDHEAQETIERMEKNIKALEEQLETVGGLTASTAAVAITNNATLQILAATSNGTCSRATASAHSEQRKVLMRLLQEAGIDLPKLQELDAVTDKAVKDYFEMWDRMGSTP
jgi:molybdenum cofactor biosynthesis enzyme MoaA